MILKNLQNHIGNHIFSYNIRWDFSAARELRLGRECEWGNGADLRLDGVSGLAGFLGHGGHNLYDHMLIVTFLRSCVLTCLIFFIL